MCTHIEGFQNKSNIHLSRNQILDVASQKYFHIQLCYLSNFHYMLKAEIIRKLADKILLLVKTIVSKPRIKYEKILSIMKIHQCKKGEEQSPQRPKLCIHSSKSLLSLSWPLHYNFSSLIDMEPLTKCIDVKLLQRDECSYTIC